MIFRLNFCPRGGTMATIHDVAKAAGVSAKTVSRVLNGDGPVGRVTREAVEAAIAQMSYVPSSAARMMRSNKSGLIGLITGAISRAPALDELTGLPDLFIVQGIQQVMAENGRTLMIADTAGSFDKVAPLIRTFQEYRVEGLIYVADHHQEISLPDTPSGAPLVLVNCFDWNGTPSVVPDDEQGQFAIVSRIIAEGHRRIGYLTLPTSSVATQLRSNGYRSALRAAGIPFDPALVCAAYGCGQNTDVTMLSDAIDQMLLNQDPPSVLCFGNDEMALRGYGILRTRGITVPDQISVAGFDDYRAISTMLVPPLSTVDLPYRRMGHAAANRLISMIEDPGSQFDSKTIVDAPVVWRGSVTTRRT
jgi:LacI family transcriptional regulator